ncbi:hypothetical protein WAK64_00420 [Bacillus spongiae]|uniref:DUF2178 domain-containing protein n=1 Tax=Bacillus spongiae TaxID=2683610 RepID=A0ABU8H8F2_9BACI
MKFINILLGVLLTVAGVSFFFYDGQKIVGTFLILGGISFISEKLFFYGQDDKRREKIIVNAGYSSYLFSLLWTSIILVLFHYGVVDNPLNGFLLILIGNVLVFQIMAYYYIKTQP